MALLVAVPAAVRTGWLYAHLRSDLEELLPADSPSVVALNALKARLGTRKFLGVVVDAASPAALPSAEAFIDLLAERARAYPRGMLNAVRTGNDVEAAFLKLHGALYLDQGDLRTLRERLEARRDYEVSREAGTLLDEAAPPPSMDIGDIRSKYEPRFGAAGSAGRTRYTSDERHLSVLLLELGDTSVDAAGASAVVERVKTDAAALRASDERFAPLRVGYAGDAAIATEELSALVTDLSFSSVVVLVLVLGAIALYYRWWRSVLVVFPPLLLATVYSFGLASLPPFRVAAVNSNTAFLASIIVGNGVNFGLVLLSRYVEERRLGLAVRESTVRAVEGARAGTLAAAAAAAAAYAALSITQFQGFRQFGFIGGLGMLFAWGTSFLLMPSLIAWLDTGDATRPKPVPTRGRASYWVARGIASAPRAILLGSAAATLIAAVAVAKFRATDLESDFSRLRRRDTWTSGEGYWGERMNAVLGEYLTPLVFLADQKEGAQAVATDLRRRLDDPPLAGRISSVRTIDDVLPTSQDAKLGELALIRRDLTSGVRASLDTSTRDEVDRLVSDEAMRKITLEDLPRSFSLGLRERDGSSGRVVLVYPNPSGAWWDANAMASVVEALRTVGRNAAHDGASGPAGGIPLTSDIVQAIRRDGPVASAAAFIAVTIVVALMLRNVKKVAYVIGALTVGVLWMAGASHLLGIRINFANFIAFPITFGIGVDYAVNVISRYERDGSKDILGAVRSTGAAVALCSLTTIIGYSSLLMAQNRALFLFGLIAVLGEVSCLAVALVALPALVLWMASDQPASLPTYARSSGSALDGVHREPNLDVVLDEVVGHARQHHPEVLPVDIERGRRVDAVGGEVDGRREGDLLLETVNREVSGDRVR
jgi:predicted RND superfamily exporter protein